MYGILIICLIGLAIATAWLAAERKDYQEKIAQLKHDVRFERNLNRSAEEENFQLILRIANLQGQVQPKKLETKTDYLNEIDRLSRELQTRVAQLKWEER